MVAEREALRMGIERLGVLLPTKVSLFDFEIENLGRTVQYKRDSAALRSTQGNVNDAHHAGANRLQNQNQICTSPRLRHHTATTPQHNCNGAVDGLVLCSNCILAMRIHQWVPVDTHSTPVPVRGRLWVARRHKHSTGCNLHHSVFFCTSYRM